MNALRIARSYGRSAVAAIKTAFLEATTFRIGVVSGTLLSLYPNLAPAATDGGSGARMGLGRLIENSTRELTTGGTLALKLGCGALGLGMVGYAIWAGTLGRKDNSRDHPMGQTLAIGLGGAALLGLTAAAAVMNTTIFGSDGVDSGAAFNLDDIDEGADRGSNDTGD